MQFFSGDVDAMFNQQTLEVIRSQIPGVGRVDGLERVMNAKIWSPSKALPQQLWVLLNAEVSAECLQVSRSSVLIEVVLPSIAVLEMVSRPFCQNLLR